MAISTASNLGGAIAAGQVLIGAATYVGPVAEPTKLITAMYVEQGTAPGSRTANLEIPEIDLITNPAGAALSEGFSAMTPAACLVTGTTITPVLQGVSVGLTNDAARQAEIDFLALGEDAPLVVAMRLALARRANTLMNTSILTLTDSVGSGTALTWATLASGCTTARGNAGVGNSAPLLIVLPAKGIRDLASDITTSGATYLANSAGNGDGGPAAALRAALGQYFGPGGAPVAFFINDLNLYILQEQADAQAPTNSGNYECGLCVAPLSFIQAVDLAGTSADPVDTSSRAYPVTPTLVIGGAPDPVPASALGAVSAPIRFGVGPIEGMAIVRSYSGADGLTVDGFARMVCPLRSDNGVRVIFVQ